MARTKKVVKKAESRDESAILADLAIKGILGKKGEEVVSMNLRNIKTAVSDYFIVCHANSSTHVTGLALSVEEEIYKATGVSPWHKEGFENAEWILLDYITVIVHIFQQEKRRFYGIEKLWADAEVIRIE